MDITFKAFSKISVTDMHFPIELPNLSCNFGLYAHTSLSVYSVKLRVTVTFAIAEM